MRRRVSFTQYLQSHEDQDITRLLNYTKTQGRIKDEGFLCALEWMRGGVHIVVIEEI